MWFSRDASDEEDVWAEDWVEKFSAGNSTSATVQPSTTRSPTNTQSELDDLELCAIKTSAPLWKLALKREEGASQTPHAPCMYVQNMGQMHQQLPKLPPPHLIRVRMVHSWGQRWRGQFLISKCKDAEQMRPRREGFNKEMVDRTVWHSTASYSHDLYSAFTIIGLERDDWLEEKNKPLSKILQILLWARQCKGMQNSRSETEEWPE